MVTMAPERKEEGLGKTFKVIGCKSIPIHLAVFPLEKYSQNLPVNGSHGHAADSCKGVKQQVCWLQFGKVQCWWVALIQPYRRWIYCVCPRRAGTRRRDQCFSSQGRVKKKLFGARWMRKEAAARH